MIFFKSIFIIFTHYYFIHSIFKKKFKKYNFSQNIYINSILILFIITSLVYILNGLNFYYLIISIVGSTYFFLIDKNKKKIFSYKNVYLVLLFILLIFICILPPLTSFDGRSIWFFHSKILYFEKIIWSNIWFAEEVSFSQIHYPKLNAIISAYFSNLNGLWNYNFSKISLPILLFPALIFFYKIFNSYSHGIINLLIIFVFFKTDLFNGYMDPILSIYALIGLISVCEIFKKKNLNEYLIILGLTIFIIANLKDEGVIIVFLILIFFFIFFIKNYKILLKNRFFYLSLGLCILGLIFNFGWKYFIFLGNSLSFYGENQFQNIQFNWENTNIILKFLIFERNLILYFPLLLLVNILIFLFKSNILQKLSFFICLFSILYFIIILSVYLLSPLDITWHLHSSADRVLNTLKFMITFNVINFIILLYENKFIPKK